MSHLYQSHIDEANLQCAVHEKQDAVERRAREAEQTEKCRRRRQRAEEAENWEPEHEDLGDGEADNGNSDEEEDTTVCRAIVPSSPVLILRQVHLS